MKQKSSIGVRDLQIPVGIHNEMAGLPREPPRDEFKNLILHYKNAEIENEIGMELGASQGQDLMPEGGPIVRPTHLRGSQAKQSADFGANKESEKLPPENYVTDEEYQQFGQDALEAHKKNNRKLLQSMVFERQPETDETRVAKAHVLEKLRKQIAPRHQIPDLKLTGIKTKDFSNLERVKTARVANNSEIINASR